MSIKCHAEKKDGRAWTVDGSVLNKSCLAVKINAALYPSVFALLIDRMGANKDSE